MRWNRVERGCAAAAEVAVIYPLYLLGMLYVLSRDDRARLVNVDFVRDQMVVFALVSLGALLLWGLGLWLSRRSPRVLWYQHLTANYFGVTLVWASYITGILNLAAGVVLMGAAVTGYMVLDRRVIVPAFINALLLLLGLTAASSMELIPYAPAMVAPEDSVTRVFWLHTHFFLAAPHIIFCLLATMLMLRQWRRSETRVLRLGTTDGLTGLYNHRNIMDRLEKAIVEARRMGNPLSVVLLDVDYFKAINDGRSHPVGDGVLRRIAANLTESTRDGDLVGRYGGEEFLVELPGTLLSGAMALAERYRSRLSELRMTDDYGRPFQITGSFGVATLDPVHDTGAEPMLQRADRAFYSAKHNGRNRIETLEEDPTEVPVEPAS